MSTQTVTVAEARANFSRIGEAVNKTGEPVTVFRHSKPWLVITPAADFNEPNEETQAAMIEADAILSDRSRKHFKTLEDMMAAIDEMDDDA